MLAHLGAGLTRHCSTHDEHCDILAYCEKSSMAISMPVRWHEDNKAGCRYTEALDTLPPADGRHRLLANRSLAYLRANRIEDALGDAQAAAEAAPKWDKAHWRSVADKPCYGFAIAFCAMTGVIQTPSADSLHRRKNKMRI